MLSRQRSTGHKNPARPFARGEPQTERITVRMPKDNNRRASFHVRPCPSLTCSHEDCLLCCPLMMTAHQLTILGQARVPCTCFCLCIVLAHTQTKKTMVSCKCLHTTKLQIEAIVVKNTPAAAADDNPGLPRLVFSVRFKFFGPFQATPARSVPEQGFDELQTTSTELQRRSLSERLFEKLCHSPVETFGSQGS